MKYNLIDLYRQAENYFFEGISSKLLNIADVANAYMTLVPVADLNLIYIQNETNTLDRILCEGMRFFDQDSLSFIIIIPEECCSPEMKSVLDTTGYLQTGKSSSLALKLESLITNDATTFSDCLSIHANDNKLNEWMMPLIGAFESTIDVTSHYASTHESALKKKVKLHHFSLYKMGQPIVSITLSVHSTIARIDDLGTLPEFQGKGYATRLIIYALSEAKRLGANHCFLEASDSGLGVYKKLGFHTLFKNNIYSRKMRNTQ